MRHIKDGGKDERELIHLPNSVRAKITPVRENGAPAYTYHDWSFRLDQDEIIRLLMGETLYGDPALCIREVLQNALDAVESPGAGSSRLWFMRSGWITIRAGFNHAPVCIPEPETRQRRRLAS